MVTIKELERHRAFNEVLELMTSNKKFMNSALFAKVAKLALDNNKN